MATIEHGFSDHSDIDLVDWAKVAQVEAEIAAEEDTGGDPEYQPEQSDFIDWDWE